MSKRANYCMALALAAMLVAGCGEDEPPPASATPSSRAAAPQPVPKKAPAKKAGKGAQKETLQFYPKIETFVEDPEEAEQIRHVFATRDFEPDPTGEENRDPFRSYVVRQPGVGQRDSTALEAAAEPSLFCTSKNIVAPAYSLRDLRLIGIVLRGTSAYALFRDSANHGHIVRKGDCLGQERARVAAIRTGFVSLEVVPEVAPNQPPRPAQERVVQLYPEELSIEATQQGAQQ